MSIENAFIPCAGKGTRMGPLGLKLAKPLWQVFEKSLLEIQVEMMKLMNCNRFMLNTHHLYKQIEDHTKSICNTQVIYEKELLGSGGCFHNLKKIESNLGKVISLNSDIQLILSDGDKIRLMEAFSENDFVLVCLPVKKGGDYNEVCFDENGYFIEVRAPNKKSDYVTYSGFGMVNISKLDYVKGESSFFDTVINSKINTTKIFTPIDPYEYWDWGTKELYLENITKLSDTRNQSYLKKFFIEIGVIDQNSLKENSYKSDQIGVYNFTKKDDLSKNKKGIYIQVGDDIELLPV